MEGETKEGRGEGGGEGNPHRFFSSYTTHHKSYLWHLHVMRSWTKRWSSLSLFPHPQGEDASSAYLMGRF